MPLFRFAFSMAAAVPKAIGLLWENNLKIGIDGNVAMNANQNLIALVREFE